MMTTCVCYMVWLIQNNRKPRMMKLNYGLVSALTSTMESRRTFTPRIDSAGMRACNLLTFPSIGVGFRKRREPLCKTMCAVPVERVCREKNGGITAT